MKAFVSLMSYSLTYCPLEYFYTRMVGLDICRISSQFIEQLHCFRGFRFKRDFREKCCICIQGNIILDGQRWAHGPDPEMSVVV
jgi:hypothetical protein